MRHERTTDRLRDALEGAGRRLRDVAERAKRGLASGSWRKSLQRVRWGRVLRALALGSLGGFAALMLLGIAIYAWYAVGLVSPDVANGGAGPSVAYDRSGTTLLYQFQDPLHGVREPVPLSAMSPSLIAATVATEDASFYDNPGVNIRGLARAALENLAPFGGGFLQGSGGSSITQQLARNVYIDPSRRANRDIRRKIKETVIALELKRRYSDDQIMEWYLNQIYYGDSAYGAEAAAQRYFGKSAKDLSLAEAALIAGLPQAPEDYTPAREGNRERAKQRQLEVLDLMEKHPDLLQRAGVTPEQVEAAKSEPLNYVKGSYDIRAPHFVHFVEDQVTKMCHAGQFKPPEGVECDNVVVEGGLRITTTLDTGLQQIGEHTVEEGVAATEGATGGHDGSLVAMQPETGQILAYVGSRDFFRDDIQGQVDIASSLRSHGSSMKVFTYLTAFDQGWVPSTTVKDEPLKLGGSQVNNWNFSYLGDITVRKAFSQSVNTAAVRTVMDVGIDEMRKTAHRMGITDLQQDNCGPPITLGACEVKLVDMTFAFSTLANDGMMKGRPSSEGLPDGFRQLDPVSVLSIQDAHGTKLYEFSNPDEKQVEDPAHAYMVTDILSKDAIKWAGLDIGRPAAAKTGTSEDFRDAVVMGYTPDLAVGAWVGNADNTPMAPGTFSSASVGPLWTSFMKQAHEYLKLAPKAFTVPDSIEQIKCEGTQELFVRKTPPSKPGACSPKSSPTGTPEPTQGTVTPTPAHATATPAPETPTETPGPSPEGTPGGSTTPSPSDRPTATPVSTAAPMPQQRH